MNRISSTVKTPSILKVKSSPGVINKYVSDSINAPLPFQIKVKQLNQSSQNRNSRGSRGSKTSSITDLESEKIKECIKVSKKPVRQHQERIAEYLMNPNNRGICAAFDVGTGKTLTAIITGHCLLKSGQVDKVIVVTPKSIIEQFTNEILTTLGEDEFEKMSPFFTFYTFRSFGNLLKKSKGKEGVGSLCDNALLIVDEAHILRTQIEKGKGNDALAVLDCAIKSNKVLLLTATPIVNSDADAANLIAMIRGTAPYLKFPEDAEKRKELFSNAFAFFKDVSQKSLYPNFRVHQVKIAMNEEYYKKYMEVEEANNALFPNPMRYLTGIRRACNALDNNPKVDLIIRAIKKNPEKKRVVFSNFVDSGIDILKRYIDLNATYVKYGEITGDQSSEQRNDIVNKYNSGEIKLLLMSKAGELGLDLKETREAFLMESSWNQASIDQVIGRFVRYRSHENLPVEERVVDIYMLKLVKPEIHQFDQYKSADELLEQIIEEKDININAFYKELKSNSLKV